MAKKGMGLKAAQASIERREGVPKARAGAILASAARKASPATVRKNPNLRHVSGVGRELERRLAARDKK